MTAFGKLLVIMNFLFAALTGALIVYVFTTRANWVGAYNDAKVKAESAEKAYKAERAAHENDIKQKDATLEEMKKQLDQVNGRVAAAQGDAQKAQEAADRMVAINRNATTGQEAVQAELKQIREERGVLEKEKSVLRAQVVKIQQELDKQRGDAVQSDLRARNMEQKANNLLRQVEELTVRNRELETNVSTGTGSGAGAPSILDGVNKPAPPGVRGKVTGIGTTGSGFAQVNIGSDSGLSKGNVLIVYRGMEYVGDLTLVDVKPKAAVGTFKPHRKTSVIKEGDDVATSLSGQPQ
jgi:flagellar biosynthesis GTPase FlhF